MIPISNRAKNLTPSATLAMTAKAKQMKADGIDVISFSAGEPDFDTPKNIREAAKKSIDGGDTRYTPSSGIPALKKAICRKLQEENGLTYAEKEVVVACGAKQAIYNALQVIVDDGDEVLIPSPYWVSYPDQVMLAGGKPVIVEGRSENSYKVLPSQIEKAATKRTKAVIINSPSNPSGSAYTKEELTKIAEICVKLGIAVISDEIYEKLVYDGFTHVSIAAISPEIKALTIVVNGVSKAYAMTGWRMGYAAAPAHIISKMSEIIGQQNSSIPGFVQKACVEAMSGPQDEVAAMCDEFKARRDIMYKLFSSIDGLRCHKPQGAFYLMPDVRAYLGRGSGEKKIATADDLADYLLEEAHIAVVSGDPFGAPGHVRFSYATSRKSIEEGIERLTNALSKLT